MNKIDEKYLILSHIKVENANALSSPYTIGFPAISAFLGFMHKIERQLNKKIVNNCDIKKIIFDSVIIINNNFKLKAQKDKYGSYDICRKKSPLKNGKLASFQAEAFSNIEFSLIIKIKSFNGKLVGNEDYIIKEITNIINTITFAGGDILPYNLNYSLIKDKTKVEIISKISDKKLRKHKLMTSYVLLDRSDLLKKELDEELESKKKIDNAEKESEKNKKPKDILDIILEFLLIINYCQESEENKEEFKWASKKKYKGWIVPISKGFQGLSQIEKSEKNKTENKRDSKTPHIFAESIVSIGEFKMLYHFGEKKENNDIENLFWFYNADLKNNLYLCEQKQLNKKECDEDLEDKYI